MYVRSKEVGKQGSKEVEKWRSIKVANDDRMNKGNKQNKENKENKRKKERRKKDAP